MDNININEVTREEPNSGEKENRERRLELDLLKSVAIISMIICHTVFMLGVHHPNYEQDIEYFVADIILGCYVAVAHAFMFSMGFGIAFSRNKKPSYL